MVAGKPAWIRVYVRSGLLGTDVPNVTGKVEILRRHGGLSYDPVVTLSPQPPGVVTAQKTQTYDTERTSLESQFRHASRECFPPSN